MTTRASKQWQLSLHRTVMVPREEVWRALQGGRAPQPGARFALHDGIRGIVREVRPPGHLRLSVEDRAGAHSTLEIELAPYGRARTAICLHHHGLPDRQAREAFRQRWSDGLARLVSRLD